MNPLASTPRALTALGLVLLWGLPWARAESPGEAGPLPCAACCANRPDVPPSEPNLSKRRAEVVGAAAGLALGFALGRTGSSAASPALTPLRTRDALLTGGGAFLLFSPRLFAHDEPIRLPSPSGDCARSGAVNGFDRKLRDFALGDRSLEKRELLARLSWATLTAALAQPIALTLSGDAPHKWSRDLPVWGEAAFVSIAVDLAVKQLVRRQRPYARFCEPPRDSDLCGKDARLSFYSGHTSAAFVAAVAAGTIADSHHLANRKWVWASGLTLATTTGVLRVTADKHYSTDVLTGAIAGSLAGWLIPRIHRPDPVSHAPTVASRREPGPALALPLALRTGNTHAFVSAGLVDGGPFLQLRWHW